jgi:ligand-binding sensor domain-containing protein
LALGQNDDPLYATSKGLYLFDGSTATAFKNEDKLVSNFVDSFATVPDGQLWVGTDGGIQTLDPNDPNGQWTTFIKSQTTGLGGNWASGLAAAADGVVWAAVINGDASRYENGTWTTLKDLYSFNVVTVDDDNKAWFGDDGKGIIVLNPDGSPATAFTAADGLPSDRVSALITDNAGAVWIGTDNGLASYAQGTLNLVFGKDDKRLPNRYIRDLALAPDGALIIGTFTGVARLAGDEVTILIDFLKDGYPQARLTTLAIAPDGRIWAGTDKGLLYTDDGGQWTMLTTQDGLLTNYISALLVDPYGTTWVGGGGSNFDGGGILHMVP